MNKSIGMMMIILLPILCLLLISCAEKTPPIRYYHIDMHTNDIKTTSSSIYESIKVTVRGANNSIYYTDNRYGKNAFTFNRWIESPNDMLKNKIIYALQKSGIATHVLSSTSHGTAQYLLEIDIEDLSMHIEQNQIGEGVMIISANLMETKHRNVVKSASFRCSNPAGEINPQSAVDSINKASNVCTAKLVEWLQE